MYSCIHCLIVCTIFADPNHCAELVCKDLYDAYGQNVSQIVDIFIPTMNLLFHVYTCNPPSRFSSLGTQVSYSFCVYVFVLFGCGVLGLKFLSSLPNLVLYMSFHVHWYHTLLAAGKK